MTVISDRRQHVKRVLLKRNGYQFGQPKCGLATDDTPGDVACMDTSIQLVARIVKGKWYSIDYIRRLSRAPHHVPMPVANAAIALQRLGLNYRLVDHVGASDIIRLARRRGPVIIAEDYWAHPQWKGYLYAGKRQDGRAKNQNGRIIRVGFADPEGHAGNNQWTFRDGHAVVVATTQPRGESTENALVRDSNHHSASRPERPKWDEITVGQLGRMLRSFNEGRNRAVWIPMEVVLKP